MFRRESCTFHTSILTLVTVENTYGKLGFLPGCCGLWTEYVHSLTVYVDDVSQMVIVGSVGSNYIIFRQPGSMTTMCPG